MKGLGSSIGGTIVALVVLGLAAVVVAIGWRWGSNNTPFGL